ncbi:Leucine-rich PPR motif-containing protein, mitochondrial [Harpegnathos saltator]|uniref:Leucine-rich PPR motif-containing protein, mitochondrial n=1 Tax=Harpegnathos saltator TaxID=610380 RepID=E2BUE3_HARSA|nr:Leucine-rich PPR motif-containing protein, mitochondrial [Harpegnathos saltator]
MLHLRKYVLTVLRSDIRSRVICSLHSTSSLAREGGYVLRSLHHCYISPTISPTRPNYRACGVRTFSITTSQSSVDDVNQKLTSFCNDVEQGQIWSADRLEEVIQLCNESKYQLQPSTGVLLLKCCGSSLSTLKPNDRQGLLDRVWQLAKRNDSALTLEHYNTLLNMYAENSSSVDPNKFLSKMSVKPDDDTYRLLLNTAIKTGNITHLRNIVSMIKARNILLDENTYCTLMQTYLAQGNITEALNVITSAQNANLPVNRLYTELACGYAAQGDILNLVKILNDEVQDPSTFLQIIKSLSVSGNGRHIPVIMNFLTSSVTIVMSEINSTINELVRANQFMDAYAIVNCIALNKESAKHAKSIVNNFLNQLIITNATNETIMKFANNFVESEYEPMALANIAETSLKLGREKLSLAIFNAMRKRNIEIRPHYYWPLLVNAQRNEGEAKIYSLIDSMKTMNVDFDFETLVHYIFPYLNTANPIITLQKLKMIDIQSYFLNTPMIYFLLQNNRLEDVICLYDYMHMKLNYRILLPALIEVYLATRNIKDCARVLTAHEEGHNCVSLFLFKLLRQNSSKLSMEEFHLLLKTFYNIGVKLTTQDADILKNRINNANITSNLNMKLANMIDKMTDRNLQFPIITIIPHPRFMSINELTCHLVELKSEGLGTKNILRRLFDIYYLQNNLEKAEEIKKEYDKNQYVWSSGMKIQLFEIYVKHNKLKEAEMLLLDMRNVSSTFLVDSKKILLFAIALVKADKVKTAFDIIENFPNVNNKKNMSRSCAKLLNALAEREYHENTKRMLHLLLNKRYCDMTVEVLRPLIAIPLKQNNIPLAVDTLANCMRLYQKLPLVLEVFTALLRERDGSRLENVNKYIEEVYNMMANTYSVEAANTALVIALANLEKMEELQSILQQQRIIMNNLMHYFNFAQKSNNVKSLLMILKATQDSNNVNQIFLCDTLLAYYSKYIPYIYIYTHTHTHVVKYIHTTYKIHRYLILLTFYTNR